MSLLLHLSQTAVVFFFVFFFVIAVVVVIIIRLCHCSYHIAVNTIFMIINNGISLLIEK